MTYYRPPVPEFFLGGTCPLVPRGIYAPGYHTGEGVKVWWGAFCVKDRQQLRAPVLRQPIPVHGPEIMSKGIPPEPRSTRSLVRTYGVPVVHWIEFNMLFFRKRRSTNHQPAALRVTTDRQTDGRVPESSISSSQQMCVQSEPGHCRPSSAELSVMSTLWVYVGRRSCSIEVGHMSICSDKLTTADELDVITACCFSSCNNCWLCYGSRHHHIILITVDLVSHLRTWAYQCSCCSAPTSVSFAFRDGEITAAFSRPKRLFYVIFHWLSAMLTYYLCVLSAYDCRLTL